jgi:hypothetical protein
MFQKKAAFRDANKPAAYCIKDTRRKQEKRGKAVSTYPLTFNSLVEEI